MGSRIVPGNMRSPDNPVKYIIAKAYVQGGERRGAFLITDVTDLVPKYGAENIMILGQSLKLSESIPGDKDAPGKPPVPHLINRLVEDVVNGKRRFRLFVGTSEFAGNSA
eukprot:5710296-Pleurochrysis_carterae.AAC.1